jgi:glycosyltransferase involved in cell wall biosynthesis
LDGRNRTEIKLFDSVFSFKGRFFEMKWVNGASSIMGRLIALLPIRVARRLIRWPLPSARPRQDGPKQLLIDVSVIAINDARTGIQRVVRALWDQLVKNPPVGYRVRSICATRKRGYCYAPDFLNNPEAQAVDKTSGAPVQVGPGDIFLGLDLTSYLLPRHQSELARWKRRGGTLYFMVYDLLPVHYPNWFKPKTSKNHKRWLRALAIFADHVVCISNVVKTDMASWLKTRYGLGPEALPISTIPLGGDVAASIPSRGLPADIDQLLEEFRSRPSVLAVGTLEPRKGHAQVLAAFEHLWDRGRKVNLVIVGKPGWKTEALQEYLVDHPQKQRLLFWLHDVSDEMLELLYSAALGVIVASEAEGCGLPLIEALHHDKPVLARDIPVFREIGGDRITYFTGNNGTVAEDVDNWLNRIAQAQVPPIGVPLQTWQDSALHLLFCLGLKTD